MDSSRRTEPRLDPWLHTYIYEGAFGPKDTHVPQTRQQKAPDNHITAACSCPRPWSNTCFWHLGELAGLDLDQTVKTQVWWGLWKSE